MASGHLTAEPIEIEVAGRPVRLLGYGGRLPGPAICLRHDETLARAFENRLGEPPKLDTHGLSVTPEGEGDNPFRHVAPAEVAACRLPPRGAPLNGGLHWYHPHLHALPARQLFAGLAGPIIVAGPEDPGLLIGTHDERVLTIELPAGARRLRVTGRWRTAGIPANWPRCRRGASRTSSPPAGGSRSASAGSARCST